MKKVANSSDDPTMNDRNIRVLTIGFVIRLVGEPPNVSILSHFLDGDMFESGVGDGIRTHNRRDHNLEP